MKTIFFDIETIPSQLPGIRDELASAVTAPAQYKKPESIAEWLKAGLDAPEAFVGNANGVDLVTKDLGLAVDLGRDLGVRWS